MGWLVLLDFQVLLKGGICLGAVIECWPVRLLWSGEGEMGWRACMVGLSSEAAGPRRRS